MLLNKNKSILQILKQTKNFCCVWTATDIQNIIKIWFEETVASRHAYQPILLEIKLIKMSPYWIKKAWLNFNEDEMMK